MHEKYNGIALFVLFQTFNRALAFYFCAWILNKYLNCKSLELSLSCLEAHGYFIYENLPPLAVPLHELQCVGMFSVPCASLIQLSVTATVFGVWTFRTCFTSLRIYCHSLWMWHKPSILLYPMIPLTFVFCHLCPVLHVLNSPYSFILPLSFEGVTRVGKWGNVCSALL